MTTPSVSCVVPVYNGERHLGAALQSVLAQTIPPDQVIVVDDGSTDGSAALIAGLGDRVEAVHQPNRGPASARNRGVAMADATFVAFIDQDDLWHPEKLERQLAAFTADPGLELCFTEVERFWAPGFEDEERAWRHHGRGRRVPGYTTPTLLARRSAFDRVGPLDTDLRFSDGTDWVLRAIDAGLGIHLLPEVLLYHRMHEGNLTRSRAASQAEFVRTVKATLDRRRGRAQEAQG